MASGMLVVAARPEKPCKWTFRRGSKTWRDLEGIGVANCSQLPSGRPTERNQICSKPERCLLRSTTSFGLIRVSRQLGFTLLAAVVPLLIAIPTLIYLVRYTKSTVDLRNEAAKQSRIQGEAYEASIMPLLVARFSTVELAGNHRDAVVLQNIGKGPALGVQVDPIETAQGVVSFDYIPVIEPGNTAALVCVRNTPEPQTYTTPERDADALQRNSVLYGYARHYILGTSHELKIVTRSMSTPYTSSFTRWNSVVAMISPSWCTLAAHPAGPSARALGGGLFKLKALRRAAPRLQDP